ncbi:MAG: glycosyltransferase, partial [Candidatus Omnitrophica bacterium]|nr:glycosyltransferase [Candidatus Omnitrophota bacterium]
MNKNNKTIFFAAGGTAGHIAPALAAAEALEQISSDYRIVFVTNKYSPRNKKADSNGFEETFSISGVLLGGKNYVVETLDCIGLPAGFSLKYFVFVLKLFKSFFRSLALIKKHHPSAIAAFGGYLSFPIVTAAWLSGLPVLIHEQNVMPGRVNRLLFRFVSICALSFEDSRKYFDLERGKNLIEKIISLFLRFGCSDKNDFKAGRNVQPEVIVTGMPVRKQMEVTGESEETTKEAEDTELDSSLQESDKSKFSILVMGGSQGAHYLNKVFLAALKELGPAIQKKLHVIHLSGTRDLDEIK